MSPISPNGAPDRDAALHDVVARALRAVEADAATWVENHRAPMPSDPLAYDRELVRRLQRLLATNAALAFHLHLVRRLSLEVPAERPVADALFGTVSELREWCAYAIPAVEELQARLRTQLDALMAAHDWNGPGE
jgi:hypothetical protein